MACQKQRYQKTWRVSGKAGMLLRRFGVSAALFVGVVGCAGAERTGQSAQESGERQLALAATATAPAAPEPRVSVVVPPGARQAVVDAREARNRKQWDALERLVPLAQTDPVLGTYAEYWHLHRKLVDPTIPVPDDEMRLFMQTHPSGYLADRLKGDWLVAAARSGNYRLAVDLWPLVNANTTETCAYWLALHLTGGKVDLQQLRNEFKPVGTCWELLDQLAADKALPWEEQQWLFRELVETNRTGNVRRMAAILFDGAEMNSFSAIMKNPRAWLEKAPVPKSRTQHELTTFALARLAYGDNRAQNATYAQTRWASRLSQQDMQWVWSHFGLVAALNVEPNAVQWYRQSGSFPLTDYNHAWQVRSELRQNPIDWNQVARAIQRMSKRQASETVWMYWYGRAQQALGNPQLAQQRYEAIAGEFDFYGQLATEELGRSIAIPPRPAPVTPQELHNARNHPGLQRAVALFDLGWRAEAVPEWSYALRGMSDRELLAAAEFAREQQIYDRVVNTSLLTRNEIDFTQRFIAPFEGRVTEKAREVDLDPAWVYGLIRQESRFITDARSRVGASGLMQLMPATARWVARKIGMNDFRQSDVNDFEVNTILGTRYLSMVLDDLNRSEILATAGYNAGPGRPVQWRSKLLTPVEGAIFAETIPFTETRLYVKNVMSNATYYALLFTGKPQSLKDRLGTVAPQPGRQVALP